MPTHLNLYKNPCNWCMFTQMVLMVVSFKSQPNYFKACLIKWTTSGEPLVGLKTHQGSKLGHSAVVL